MPPINPRQFNVPESDQDPQGVDAAEERKDRHDDYREWAGEEPLY